MKPNFKFLRITCLFALFALFCFNSCQDEVNLETDNPEELIAPNSTVADLMRSTASNDGSVDNVMDDANCFSVNLPVTIIVNNITITINTLNDLVLIEEIFDEYEDDEDILEFLFPITIILNDYTEIVIENEDQLEGFIEDCTEVEEDDVIECVDFVYPISFSIYNSDFQLIDTVLIDDDQELYEFLESLEDNPNGAVIASLNYPVSLVYADGTMVEVTSNQELEAAINAAEEECDDEEEEDCGQDEVAMYLKECFWNIVAYNGDDHLIEYDVYFNEDGTIEIVNGDTTEAIGGEWEMSISNDGFPELVISNLTAFSDELEGSWIITECDDDRFELIQQIQNNTVEMVIEQDCEDDEEECFEENIRMYLLECFWYSGSNLMNNDNNGPYYFYENNVVEILSPAGNPVPVLGTWDIATTEDGVILVLTLPEPYHEISEITWLAFECEEDRIKFINGEDYLVFERECEGEEYDCEDLQANFGDDCEDANGNIGFINQNCECEVESDEYDCENLQANIGDECEDTNGNLGVITENCECEVENDEYDCEDLQANFGDNCTNPATGEEGFINENCECEVEEEDPFECFGDYGLSVCDEEDGDQDGFGVFNLDSIFANCPNDDVEYNFYETLADAQNDINPLTSPYTNIANPQGIYSRVYLAGDPNTFEIFEHILVVEDCSQGDCSEQEVDAYLVECTWNVVNYNGSDDLVIFDFDFNTDGTVIIVGGGQTITAMWSTSLSDDGVVVEFSQVNGSNIQAITGNWLVVECDSDRLEMQRENDFMVMEQNCI